QSLPRLGLSSSCSRAHRDVHSLPPRRSSDLCEWGMSELGPLAFGGGDEPVFLGRDYVQRTEFSEDTAVRIDREIERLVRGGYERSEEHTSELQSREKLVWRLLLEKKMQFREI